MRDRDAAPVKRLAGRIRDVPVVFGTDSAASEARDRDKVFIGVTTLWLELLSSSLITYKSPASMTRTVTAERESSEHWL